MLSFADSLKIYWKRQLILNDNGVYIWYGSKFSVTIVNTSDLYSKYISRLWHWISICLLTMSSYIDLVIGVYAWCWARLKQCERAILALYYVSTWGAWSGNTCVKWNFISYLFWNSMTLIVIFCWFNPQGGF